MSAEKRASRRNRKIYPLGEFNLAGFSMSSAFAGEQVQILTSAVLFSDNPFFHHCMRGFANDVDAKLRERGVPVQLSQAGSFAIVVKPDFTAKLYVDCLDVTLEMAAKRAVKRGEAVYSNDIGDIYRGSIRYPKIGRDQHFIICLRYGWKFLLIFDLTPEKSPNLDALENSIGFGMRRLMFETLYEAMADERVFAEMVAKGWFPFNELIGAEFEDLQRAVAHNFNLDAVEKGVVDKFDSSRISHLSDRWWRNPQYAARRDLLNEGVSLFLEGRYIPSIKTLLTEIEGILRERHVPRTSGRQGMDKVLAIAFSEVLKFAGADTIYFPEQFIEYLRTSVFGHFDPDQPATIATRNTVGHGLAVGTAYTAVRALQTILVLDQINRYLTLPNKASRRRSSGAKA